MPDGTFTAIDGVCRCSVVSVLAGRSHVNVFHVSKTEATDWSQAQVDAIATGMRLSYKTRFLPRVGNIFHLKDVNVVDLGSILGKTGLATGDDPGTLAGFTAIPNNVALCVTWKINLHYRGGHPRSYFGGLTFTDYSNATTWAGATATAWTTAANGFLADINGLTVGGEPVKLGSVHRKLRREIMDPPIFAPWIAAVVDGRIDSQRRRLGKDVA